MDLEEILPKELVSDILRRGKWTVEEEKYAEQIIDDFDQGVLDVPDGTTLRTHLSHVLNCDPMRITKKYTGNLCIGKRTYTQKVTGEGNFGVLSACHQRLKELRRVWINKLLLAEQWHSRKMSTAGRTSHINHIKSPLDGTDSTANGHGNSAHYQYFNHPSLDTSMYTTSQSNGFYQSSPHNLINNVSSNNGMLPSFSEDRVRYALLPYIADSQEIESLLQWLRVAHDVVGLELVDGSNSLLSSQVVLERLTAVGGDPPSATLLYKVILSCCLADNPRLQSAVQAVFELQMMQLSTVSDVSGSTENVVEEEKVNGSISTERRPRRPIEEAAVDDSNSKRMRLEMMVEEEYMDDETSSQRSSPVQTATQSGAAAQLMLDCVFPHGSDAFPCDGPLSSSSSSSSAFSSTAGRLSLSDCLRGMQQQEHHPSGKGLLQGPISARAAQYMDQQRTERQLSSSLLSTTDSSGSTSVCSPVVSFSFLGAHRPVSDFSSCLISPAMLQAQLNQSLDKSITVIAEKIVQQLAAEGPVDPAHVTSAAEALMGLVEQRGNKTEGEVEEGEEE